MLRSQIHLRNDNEDKFWKYTYGIYDNGAPVTDESIYKLHISISIKHYSSYRNSINAILEDAIRRRVITTVKCVKYTEKNLLDTQEQNKALRKFFNGLYKPDMTRKPSLEEFNDFHKYTQKRYYLNDDWQIVSVEDGKPVERSAVIKKALLYLKKCKDSTIRQCNNPFVLYLPKEIDLVALSQLCQEIEKILKTVPTGKDYLSPADLELSYKHCIFRQAFFKDNKPIELKQDYKEESKSPLEEKKGDITEQDNSPEQSRFLVMKKFSKKEAFETLKKEMSYYIFSQSDNQLYYLDNKCDFHPISITPEECKQLNIPTLTEDNAHLFMHKMPKQVLANLKKKTPPEREPMDRSEAKYVEALDPDKNKINKLVQEAKGSDCYQFLNRMGRVPETYHKIWQDYKENKHSIIALLNDYTKGDGISANFKLFFSGHLRRHHTVLIRKKVKEYNNKNIDYIIEDIKKLLRMEFNPNSSLKRRLIFILDMLKEKIPESALLVKNPIKDTSFKGMSTNPIAWSRF